MLTVRSTAVVCGSLVMLAAVPVDSGAQSCTTPEIRYKSGTTNTCPGSNPGMTITDTKTYEMRVNISCQSNSWKSMNGSWNDLPNLNGRSGCGPGEEEEHAPACPATWDTPTAAIDSTSTQTDRYKGEARVHHQKYVNQCAGDGSTTVDRLVDSGACQGDFCCDQGNCSETGEFYHTTCTCVISPIIIDLGGEGFRLTDASHGVIFDLAGNGNAELVAWTARGADNVFLALDRNDNGRIDDGRELFGSATPQPVPTPPQRVNGYLALGVFDGNGDQQITRLDPIYNELRLWRDANHNGATEPGELLSLDDAGLVSISVDYLESRRRDEFGNIFRYRARIGLTNDRGKTRQRWSFDVFLLGIGAGTR
jgi:hypothetical protein